MREIITSPIFGFTLCIGTYQLAVAIKSKFNYAILTPMLVASIIIIAVLEIFDIPISDFMNGANFVYMFLAPATAALAVSIYNKLDTIKQNLIPILVGSTVGAITALVSVFVMCKLLNISGELLASLLPKSITTAFATELSSQLGGIVPLTVAAVSITGVTGAILSPYLIRLFRIEDPVAAGLAIGASSHALGTSKAIELGDIQGSASGIAVGLCGLITMIIGIFL